MNDDTYSGDLHPWIEPELEARLVALILGEASDFEREELERLMDERPELAVFKRRLEAVSGFVRESVQPEEDEEWKLSEGRRKAVLQVIEAPAPRHPETDALRPGSQNGGKRNWWHAIRVAAACLVVILVLGALTTPAVFSSMRRSDVVTRINEERRIENLRLLDKAIERHSESVGLDTSGGSGRELNLLVNNEYEPPELPNVGFQARRKSRALAELKENLADGEVYAYRERGEQLGIGNRFAGRSYAALAEEEEVAELAMDPFAGEPGEGTVLRRGVALWDRDSDGLASIEDGEKLARVSRDRGEDRFAWSDREADESGRPALGAGAVRLGGEATWAMDAPADESLALGEPVEALPQLGRLFRVPQQGQVDDYSGVAGKSVEAFFADESGPVSGEVRAGVRRKSGAPASAVATNIPQPAAAPVPPEPTHAFGDSVDFGTGWGSGSGGFAPAEAESRTRTTSDFIPPVAGTEVAQSTNGDLFGANVVTGGLRSGDAAITRNSIDAILNNPDRAAVAKTEPGQGIEAPVSSFAGLAGKQADMKQTWDVPAIALQQGVEVPELQDQLGRVEGEIEELQQSFEKLYEGTSDVGDAADPWEQLLTLRADEERLARLKSEEADETEIQEVAGRVARVRGQVQTQQELARMAEQLELRQLALESERSELESKLQIAEQDVAKLGNLQGEDTVRMNLYTGEGYYNLGQFDEAHRHFDAVLREDPYNAEARQWLEKINVAKSDYYRAAYDESRSRLLMEVDRAWEEADPPKPEVAELGGAHDLRTKLDSIVIPEVDFDNITVEEALGYLREKTRELDTTTTDPTNKGLNIVVRKSATDSPEEAQFDGELSALAGGIDAGNARIESLKLKNVSAGMVLQYIADQSKLRYEVDEYGITMMPLGSGEGEDLLVRTWDVPLSVISNLARDSAEGDDPFSDGSENERLLRRTSAKEALESAGISFPEDASVSYLPEVGKLVVRNTPSNLDLVEAVVMHAKSAQPEPKQELVEDIAAETPFSTFSLHVSDVSFKLAQAALEKGEWPEAERVRTEEFVNAFDYQDPTPTMQEKVACQLDQAVHPFAQQRNLLRVSMRAAALGRGAGTPLRLTVLVDNSGSMDRADRAASVQRAFDLLAAQLHGQDEVTLISFARTPRLVYDSVSGDEVDDISQVVGNLQSEGGTNLEAALQLASNKARANFLEGAQNRIILLTDGAANLGNADPDTLRGMVETLRDQGIAFDACGVGADGLNDEILESLTRKGDGRYYFLDRPEDADDGFAKQIAGALRPAAQNVKVQVEFNPKRVGRYKLYGFEKHELKKEDFRNDSVDAAELAAEEAGVAVYQVETLPEGEGPVGTVAVRFRDMTTGQMVERSWEIPYEAQPARMAEASAPMRLAGTAALFAERLKGTAVGDSVDLEALVNSARTLPSLYPNQDRIRQFIGMIEQARQLGAR